MFKPFEACVGLRYVMSKRRNHFISFVSLSSIMGITLGITAVIAVTSVMNGFEREIKEQTLEMVSHATLLERNGELSNWRDLGDLLTQHPGVIAIAPYSQSEGILTRRNNVSGVVIRGIVPELEQQVSAINEKMVSGSIDDLGNGSHGILLGTELAAKLQVAPGERLVLMSARISERIQLQVAGIFKTGIYEYDNGLAILNMFDAMEIMHLDSPTGITIKTIDALQAPVISREAAGRLPGEIGIIDWTQRNRNFFHALQTQKLVMFVILSLIIAVAAFNIISTLVMVVVDKQADIAVLRTLGASPKSIMKIFIIQGVVIGLLGMLLGDIAGIWLAHNLPGIIAALESGLQMQFLPCDVYNVCTFPSDLHWLDVFVISFVAFMLSLSATLYPAWRAASLQPAAVLRYE